MKVDETEKPVRIRRYRSKGHLIETRIFARQIHESFCAQRGCRFFGRPSVQGVCHSRLDGVERSYVERIERSAEEYIREIRAGAQAKRMSAKQYATYLEQHMFCDWMNQEFGLDHLIQLRGTVADLQLRLDAVQKKRTEKPRRSVR